MIEIALANVVLAFLSAPFLSGVVNRTKAFFAGCKGQPFAQLYYDLFKLVNKSAVYSVTTTWIFRAGPVVGLAAVMAAALIVPYGGHTALVPFNGDIILFVYLVGLARFFTVLAALDTGSSFEGMGASREVQFSVLAEPAFFLGLAALARQTGSFSLSGIYSGISMETWVKEGPFMALVAAVMLLVFITENARVPVDDPNTHLELTMIHEVMVLDHSGPDLAFILYGASLKFWVLGSLFVGMVMRPVSLNPWINMAVFAGGMMIFAVFVGVIESIMARLRMIKVPQLLVGALALSVLALIFQIR